MSYCDAGPEPVEVEVARRALGTDFERAIGVLWQSVRPCTKRRAGMPMRHDPTFGTDAIVPWDSVDVDVRERFEPDCTDE